MQKRLVMPVDFQGGKSVNLSGNKLAIHIFFSIFVLKNMKGIMITKSYHWLMYIFNIKTNIYISQ